MKNIVSILAVVAATATGASAATSVASFDPATVIWSGSVSDLEDGCMFTKNENGSMSYTENSADAGGVWEVTKQAALSVSVRGQLTTLMIEADEHIERVGNVGINELTTVDHVKYRVNVDYTAGDMSTQIERSYNVVDEEYAKRDITGWAAYTTGVNGTAASIDMGIGIVGKHMDIKLGGTATMNYSGALIDNGKYELGHTATCLQ